MFRVFCDICGEDITNYKADRAEGKNGRLRVSVMTAVDNVWNGGHACEECIRAACATVTFARRPNTAVHLTNVDDDAEQVVAADVVKPAVEHGDMVVIMPPLSEHVYQMTPHR